MKQFTYRLPSNFKARGKRLLRILDDKIILKLVFKNSAVGCGMPAYGSQIDQLDELLLPRS